MGWDSNPRATLPRPPDFKSGAFNRSATHPWKSRCAGREGLKKPRCGGMLAPERRKVPLRRLAQCNRPGFC